MKVGVILALTVSVAVAGAAYAGEITVTVIEAPDRNGDQPGKGDNLQCPPGPDVSTKGVPDAALGDRDVNADGWDDFYMGEVTYTDEDGNSITIIKWAINKPRKASGFEDYFSYEIKTTDKNGVPTQRVAPGPYHLCPYAGGRNWSPLVDRKPGENKADLVSRVTASGELPTRVTNRSRNPHCRRDGKPTEDAQTTIHEKANGSWVTGQIVEVRGQFTEVEAANKKRGDIELGGKIYRFTGKFPGSNGEWWRSRDLTDEEKRSIIGDPDQWEKKAWDLEYGGKTFRFSGEFVVGGETKRAWDLTDEEKRSLIDAYAPETGLLTTSALPLGCTLKRTVEVDMGLGGLNPDNLIFCQGVQMAVGGGLFAPPAIGYVTAAVGYVGGPFQIDGDVEISLLPEVNGFLDFHVATDWDWLNLTGNIEVFLAPLEIDVVSGFLNLGIPRLAFGDGPVRYELDGEIGWGPTWSPFIGLSHSARLGSELVAAGNVSLPWGGLLDIVGVGEFSLALDLVDWSAELRLDGLLTARTAFPLASGAVVELQAQARVEALPWPMSELSLRAERQSAVTKMYGEISMEGGGLGLEAGIEFCLGSWSQGPDSE
ncbi:hypothetical protein ACFLS0_03655 [Candidatus Bipolaricaulota bacterium]